MKKRLLTLVFATLLLSSCVAKDETDKKVDELLGQMTLKEKIGQMNQLSGGAWLVETAAKGEVGSILNLFWVLLCLVKLHLKIVLQMEWL